MSDNLEVEMKRLVARAQEVGASSATMKDGKIVVLSVEKLRALLASALDDERGVAVLLVQNAQTVN